MKAYIKPGYVFPISGIKCSGYEYTRRDAPNKYNKLGCIRHYVMCICPICNKEFEGRIDRLEYNPKITDGPRTYRCPTCAKGKKRDFKDPWRDCGVVNAEKKGINLSHAENFEGQIKGWMLVGKASEGKTDKYGLTYWLCTCLLCGRKEYVYSSNLKGTPSHPLKLACSVCLNHISSGALLIKNFLDENKINYIQEYTFDDLKGLKNGKLRFDFAIFKNKQLITLIEFDGKQHFEPIKYFGSEEEFKTRKIHDERKNEYCKEHHIKLIRIPYNYKNINDYLKLIN